MSHIVIINQYYILERQNNTTAELMGFQTLTVFIDLHEMSNYVLEHNIYSRWAEKEGTCLHLKLIQYTGEYIAIQLFAMNFINSLVNIYIYIYVFNNFKVNTFFMTNSLQYVLI